MDLDALKDLESRSCVFSEGGDHMACKIVHFGERGDLITAMVEPIADHGFRSNFILDEDTPYIESWFRLDDMQPFEIASLRNWIFRTEDYVYFGNPAGMSGSRLRFDEAFVRKLINRDAEGWEIFGHNEG